MDKVFGWVVSGYLRYGGFKWLKYVDNFDVNSISNNSSMGHILKVDLEYPDVLDALHNDYLLAPESVIICCDILSDYCRRIACRYEIKVGYVMKLIPSLSNKANYVVHHRNFQFYFSLAMKLGNIHKVLKFKQPE